MLSTSEAVVQIDAATVPVGVVGPVSRWYATIGRTGQTWWAVARLVSLIALTGTLVGLAGVAALGGVYFAVLNFSH
jgi:hypothetical protein